MKSSSFLLLEDDLNATKLADGKSLAQRTFRRNANFTELTSPSACLIRINHPLRVKWDLIVMVLAIFNCFSVPFYMAFESNRENFLLVIDTIIDSFFILDVFLNFRTTYISLVTGEEVTNSSEIARNYATSSRLYMDILAAIPFDAIAILLNLGAASLELFSLFKLIRVVRLSKIILYMRTKADVKLTMKFLQLIIFLLVYIHLVACCWFLLISGRIDRRGMWEDYFSVLYSSVAMMVGIEVMPQTFEEVVFCAVIVLMGALLTAVLFGEVAVVMTNLNAKASKLNNIINRSTTTMKNLKLPEALKNEITEYLLLTQSSIAQQEEYNQFKEEISPSLSAEVSTFLFSKVVHSTPVFCDKPFVTKKLIKKTDNIFLKPEKVVVKQFSSSDAVYFLLIGSAEVFVSDLQMNVKKSRNLEAGDYFGEIGALIGGQRSATVRVVSYTTIAKISAENFNRITDQFSETKDELIERISSAYNDTRTKNIDRMMRKIPYMRNLSNLQYTRCLYLLRPENYSENLEIVHYGEEASKIFFLVEGTVSLYFQVYSSHFSTENRRFDCLIGNFEAKSIFCATQALIKAQVSVKIKTLTPCRFLVLHATDVNTIATSTDGNLKANIFVLKRMYQEDSKSHFVFDALQIYKNSKNQFQRNCKLRFKNAVLRVIIKNRRKSTGLSLLQVFRHLARIKKSEGITWRELKNQIDKGKKLVNCFEIIQDLSKKTYKNPMVYQMGDLAQDMHGYMGNNQNRLRKIKKNVKKLSRYDENLEAIEAINQQLDTIINSKRKENR